MKTSTIQATAVFFPLIFFIIAHESLWFKQIFVQKHIFMQPLQYPLVYFVYKAQVMKVFHTQAGPNYSLSILLFPISEQSKISLHPRRCRLIFLLHQFPQVPCAGSGRAPPCTRDFFVKKSSKNFISAAAGNGCDSFCYCILPRPPKGWRAG